VTALLLGGSAVIFPPLISLGHADYPHVISIKETSAYQDPALLKKAWALPVAATYHSGIDFQRNASVCGPTSLVNVLHSLKSVARMTRRVDMSLISHAARCSGLAAAITLPLPDTLTRTTWS
jgi:hypothetical protein